jgi:subtilisin-like proprotein convertase family protein
LSLKRRQHSAIRHLEKAANGLFMWGSRDIAQLRQRAAEPRHELPRAKGPRALAPSPEDFIDRPRDLGPTGATDGFPILERRPISKTVVATAIAQQPIQDLATTSSVITIADIGTVKDLRLNLDLTHSFRGDLVVKLRSPSGTEAIISNREGGSEDDVRGTFDLSVFTGEPIAGDWVLTVEDASTRDVGQLHHWGVRIQTEGDRPTPVGDPIVVVMDGGVDVSHTDLDDAMWVNPHEIANDGIDNDANGLVDDVHGFNVTLRNGEVGAGFGVQHGTHVAGIIGAEDNGIGNTGIAAGRAKLMGISGLYEGAGMLENFERAVEYVLTQKALGANIRVVNASFGDLFWDPADQRRWENAVRRLEEADILFVAATANGHGTDLNDLPDMPANVDLSNVITVAGMNAENEELGMFSSFGDRVVELAAVGENVLSTVPGNIHESRSGTSMATPMVAATAARMFAENPALTAAQVRRLILETVDFDPDLVGKVSTSGKLNVERAIEAARASLDAAEARTWFDAVAR